MGMNFTMLRLMRLCKLVRVLRVLRVFKFFSVLRVLISSIVRGMGSLFWSMCVLFLLILLAGVLMSQVLADYILDEKNPLSTREWVFTHYGGSARATLTMFEATMSGCWPNYSRRLVEEVSVSYAVFFVAYISAVVFAVTRIISAIFLKDTLESSKKEADNLIVELRGERMDLMRKLEEFFREAD